MVITKFTPSARLTKFIKCYYYLENTDDQFISDTFFADGCIEAVFSLGWDFYKDGSKEAWAKIIGQIIKPRDLHIIGKGQSFGIWFYPHTFSFFSNIEMSAFTDRVLSWDVLFPNSIAESAGNCLHEKRVDKLVDVIDAFLLKKISGHKDRSMDVLTESAIRYLNQYRGASDLNQLATTLNVSQRYLQKAFLTKIGFSQKQYVRILRFQQSLHRLSQRETPYLTALALENDFYDQSHFIREFKAFTGFLPSEFEAKKLPINQHFLVPD